MKTNILLFVAVITSLTAFSQKKWTIRECVDHALENNITIKQNKLNLEIAKTEIKNAKGNFLPTLNGSTGGQFGIGPVINTLTNTRVGSTNSFGGSLGLNAGITIFNGFRNLNIKKQAELGVEGSKLDLKIIQDNISLNVINAYLNVLFAKENLNVARVQASISKKQIARAKTQFEAGVKPKGELLNAKSTAANDEQNVIAKENALNLALLNLAQLLQVDSVSFDVAPIDVGSPSAALLYNSPKEVYEKALLNRPEIENAKLDIESTNLSIDIAKSSYFPTITASMGANTNYYYDLKTSTSQLGLFKQMGNQLRYSLGFNVNIPIFNGFKNDIGVEQSKIKKEISEVSLENKKLQLQQTIEQAFLDAKAAAKTYEVAQISLSAQKEAFKNAQERYNYGAMTLFDFDQVRNRLVNAESAMIRAKYDYVFKTKVLKFYYGETILE